jgi:predicted ATPase
MSENLNAILRQLKNARQLEPYIAHIRFPHFKNLDPNLQIEFDFPLTALVGQNGCNKSSILRALYGCPSGNSIGRFWFSTAVDPIADTGERPRFVYGYFNSDANQLVEATKKRIQKENDPDYWEPARPMKRDGMIPPPSIPKGQTPPAGRDRTRWNQIQKDTIFLDFRSIISAYDKFFYHGNLQKTLRRRTKRRPTKQDFIREQSRRLLRIINQNLTVFSLYNIKKLTQNILLPEEEVLWVSDILGRQYEEIRLIEHELFGNEGFSAILHFQDRQYSEAFAGSGEFAVVMLVHEVLNASEKSLILLDEPEVSLHPGAQEKVIHFLKEQIKSKKHQVIIGTHSPSIINQLPKEGIKFFFLDESTKTVRLVQETLPGEAFIRIGAKVERKLHVYAEDPLAQELVKRSLKPMGQSGAGLIEIKLLPGGAGDLLKTFLPLFAFTESRTNLVVLDGDQRMDLHKIPKDRVLESYEDDKILSLVQEFVGKKIKIPADSKNGSGDKEQMRDGRIKILRFLRDNVIFLPGEMPEQFIWENSPIKDEFIEHTEILAEADYKLRFERAARLNYDRESFYDITSGEILDYQKLWIAKIDPGKLSDIHDHLKRVLEKESV